MPPRRARYFSAMPPKRGAGKAAAKDKTAALPTAKLRLLDAEQDNAERRKLKKQILADEEEKILQQAEDRYRAPGQ